MQSKTNKEITDLIEFLMDYAVQNDKDKNV